MGWIYELPLFEKPWGRIEVARIPLKSKPLLPLNYAVSVLIDA